GDEEVWISRNDLVRALYPVGYSMRQAVLQI
ncbi:TPA: pyridoxamine 5'-phosphate oxidase family protein, partial [Neisseria gonorrhoeae]